MENSPQNIRGYTDIFTVYLDGYQPSQTKPRDALRHVVLYTMVDSQCDKLAVVVGRTKLTTLATVDVP